MKTQTFLQREHRTDRYCPRAFKTAAVALALTGSSVIAVSAPSFAQTPPQTTTGETPLVRTAVDIDGDGKRETVITDSRLAATQSYGLYLEGSHRFSMILAGTQGGAKLLGSRDADTDPRDREILIQDPSLSPGSSLGRDLDGDGDFDILVVAAPDDKSNSGTVNPSSGRGGRPSGPARYDAKPVRYENTMAHYDTEPVRYQNTMAQYNTAPVPVDGTSMLQGGMPPLRPVVRGKLQAVKGTLPVMVDPSAGPSVRRGRPRPGTAMPVNRFADIDGDGELEELLTDGQMLPGTAYPLYLTGSKGMDALLIGVKGGARIVATRDADQDPDDTEIFLEDPNLGSHDTRRLDVDEDGDFDLAVSAPRSDRGVRSQSVDGSAIGFAGGGSVAIGSDAIPEGPADTDPSDANSEIEPGFGPVPGASPQRWRQPGSPLELEQRSRLAKLRLPSSSIPSGQTVTVKVLLQGPAPRGGMRVHLATTNPAVAVPESVLIPEGSACKSFAITASAVTAPQHGTVTVTGDGVSLSRSVVVLPANVR